MSLPVVLSAAAEADVQEAALHYEKQRAGLGVRFVRQLRDACSRIGDHPDIYLEVLDGVRRAPVRRYAYGVFYRTRADRVDVIAVFHNRRDPRIWKTRV